jgi:hypothetical protein
VIDFGRLVGKLFTGEELGDRDLHDHPVAQFRGRAHLPVVVHEAMRLARRGADLDLLRQRKAVTAGGPQLDEAGARAWRRKREVHAAILKPQPGARA